MSKRKLAPRLPEPDYWLMGSLRGPDFEGQERAEWHDQWHLDNPAYGACTTGQPRSAHRPGWLERLRRAL